MFAQLSRALEASHLDETLPWPAHSSPPPLNSFRPSTSSRSSPQRCPRCKGCDLYKHAIQVVPGAGSSRAKLMLVGEQPGNEEDKQGAPFVGPAGGLLRRAMDELHIKPAEVFMTNAVKHFKFVQRGKLRLHQSPRMSELNACRPWLAAEIDAVKPRVILCLGASAAKSLLGGTFALMKQRGQILSTPYAEQGDGNVPSVGNPAQPRQAGPRAALSLSARRSCARLLYCDRKAIVARLPDTIVAMASVTHTQHSSPPRASSLRHAACAAR